MVSVVVDVENHNMLRFQEVVYVYSYEMLNSYIYTEAERPRFSADRLVVPCGRCAACLSNRRQDWAIRLKEELKSSTFSLFVTLTYADDETNGNLCKRDIQLFFKILRKAFKRPIRYYAIGEYGSRTFRPHYHLILFNIDDADLICKSWKHGFCHVGSVTEQSIMYVCKYHVNRLDYPVGLEPTFCLMSKGIGRDYVKRMSEYHSLSLNNAFYSDYSLKKKLPRYYRDKLYSSQEKECLNNDYLMSSSNLDAMKKWLSSHPNSNYFADLQARYQSLNANFKNKSNFNEKL